MPQSWPCKLAFEMGFEWGDLRKFEHHQRLHTVAKDQNSALGAAAKRAATAAATAATAAAVAVGVGVGGRIRGNTGSSGNGSEGRAAGRGVGTMQRHARLAPVSTCTIMRDRRTKRLHTLSQVCT